MGDTEDGGNNGCMVTTNFRPWVGTHLLFLVRLGGSLCPSPQVEEGESRGRTVAEQMYSPSWRLEVEDAGSFCVRMAPAVQRSSISEISLFLWT